MRTSQTITNQEAQLLLQFASANLIVSDGGDGQANGAFLADYFINVWNEPVTTANLAAARDKLLPHLKLYGSLAEAKLAQSAINNPQETALASDWFTRQEQLETEGELGARNLAMVIEWLQARRYSFNDQNFYRAVQSIIGSPDGHRLTRKPFSKKQDSELETARVREQQVKPAVSTVEYDEPIPPYLHGANLERWKSMHVKQTSTPKPNNEVNPWIQKCEDVLLNTQRNNVRDEARQKFVKSRDGTVNWELTYHARRVLIERSKLGQFGKAA